MNISLANIVSGIELGYVINIAVYLTMAVFIAIVLTGVLVDNQNKNNTFIKWFTLSLTANIVMLVAEAAFCFFDGNMETVLITKTCAVISYCSAYLMAGFFAFCLVEFIGETTKKISYTYAYIVLFVGMVLSIFAVVGIFGEIIIFFDNTGAMQYSKYYQFISIANFLVFSSEIVFVFYYRKLLGRKSFTLSIFGILSVISMPLSLLWDTIPIYSAVSVSLLIMNNIFRNEISDRLLENERKIAESRVTNLITQIQPHFIFNTLNTIKYLCKTDATLARKTIDSYSIFLRGIIESAATERFVTIEREIEITEHYIFVEKQRFGDILTFSTDLKEKDFFLPMLTIQPIVENAVKHGIRKKAGKGNITISTYADADNNYIKISDDGVGFDVNSCEFTDGNHAGIKNVSDRIYLMTKGSMDIESTPDVGTTVVITIPKKVEKIKLR